MESQDNLVVTKALKRKTPLLLRMAVSLIATAFGIYFWYLWLNQITPSFRMSTLRLQQPIESNPLPKPVVVSWGNYSSLVVNNRNGASLQVGQWGVQVLPPLIVNSTEQVSNGERNGFLDFQVLDKSIVHCNMSGIEPSEVPYLHFPKPNSYNREECACNPVRYFVVISLQRSGSRWLETLLNNHTNVTSYGEIFIKENRKENISVILQTMDKLYNLDWSRKASKRECSAAVGFKWMLNQGLMEYHEEIVDYFRKKGVSVIFLFRRNMLRRMISRIANKYSGDLKLPNGKPKAHTHIPEEKLRDVQDFLRLPYRELQSHEIKIHQGQMSKQITNWDEVQKALTGSKYEYLLHSDYQMSS